MKSMRREREILTKFIFLSRWFQAPLYFGLIIVLVVYVYEFARGLSHLVKDANEWNSTQIMLQALDLIDVVMIANLIVMVIIGGFETFVARLNLDSHRDKPEWLQEVTAGTMKIKLALALIGISSIHLLRTFIDPSQRSDDVFWQVVIHMTFIISAIAIAYVEKIMKSGRH